jgi:hypothetical protein
MLTGSQQVGAEMASLAVCPLLAVTSGITEEATRRCLDWLILLSQVDLSIEYVTGRLFDWVAMPTAGAGIVTKRHFSLSLR